MNLRHIKSKIKSIKNVGQITKAMQLVSAVKMKRAQTKAVQGRPYREALDESIKSVLLTTAQVEHELAVAHSKTKRKLAIVISSNKGLCGVFNFNLFRFIMKEIPNVDEYDFVVMGSKVAQFVIRLGGKVIADFSHTTPFETNVTAAYTLLRESFVSGGYASVELLSNRFVSSLVFKPERIALLPLSRSSFMTEIIKKDTTAKDYIVEPDSQTVIGQLFDFYIESQIRGAIQESEAAEHSARMIAMKNATDNSKDLVQSMTLLRNRVRQTRITNELLDMNTARLAVS